MLEKKRRQLWLNAIKRKDWAEAIIKNAHVCSAHFITGEASTDENNPDFAPFCLPIVSRVPGLWKRLQGLKEKRKGITLLGQMSRRKLLGMSMLMMPY
ncbi:hypothetical protein AALO_G00116930 [Alosa alosa]|uniref:THAP-type domain-containing protein n=1 Tax=Alosa alosa TaxID=278164 RepID=A0AAV6GVJ1_9TELE|nr:hypothetical protein AALO_G00116930 [Alosa alosa]